MQRAENFATSAAGSLDRPNGDMLLECEPVRLPSGVNEAVSAVAGRPTTIAAKISEPNEDR